MNSLIQYSDSEEEQVSNHNSPETLSQEPPQPPTNTVESEPEQQVDSIQISKLLHLYNLRQKGLYFNTQLSATHAFKNPSIMNKMIAFLKIDEHGSNHPSMESNFPSFAYYDKINETLSNGQKIPKKRDIEFIPPKDSKVSRKY